MVVINIRLVGEQKDHLFNFIELDPQIHVVDLMKRIEVVTKIPPDFQQIEFRGDELLVVEHPIQTIQFGEELVVKHTSLPRWELFLIASAIQSSQTPETKKKQVLEASHILQRLYSENFFEAYTEFAIRRIKFNRAYSEFIDDHESFIKMAVERYFIGLMETKPANPTISFFYSEKPVIGIQSGFICKITCGETIQNFYIKSHSSMSSRQNVDLREIFIYKLLFYIGIGPIVHIIPNVHTSVLGVYIATLEVVGFKPSHKTTLSLEAEISLDLLKRLFNISDLHMDNFGLDHNDKLSIIDFRISGYSYNSKNLTVWCNYKQQPEKKKICEDVLKQWDLPKALRDANESMTDIKELLKSRNVSFMTSQRYARYYESISQNVDDCVRELG